MIHQILSRLTRLGIHGIQQLEKVRRIDGGIKQSASPEDAFERPWHASLGIVPKHLKPPADSNPASTPNGITLNKFGVCRCLLRLNLK